MIYAKPSTGCSLCGLCMQRKLSCIWQGTAYPKSNRQALHRPAESLCHPALSFSEGCTTPKYISYTRSSTSFVWQTTTAGRMLARHSATQHSSPNDGPACRRALSCHNPDHHSYPHTHSCLCTYCSLALPAKQHSECDTNHCQHSCCCGTSDRQHLRVCAIRLQKQRQQHSAKHWLPTT